MVHRRLVLRERITAIVGSAILFALVAMSYWYSIQTEVAGLRYVPSGMSPDFLAKDVSLTDFDDSGQPKVRASAENMQHFSDERMRAEKIRIVSLDPASARSSAEADEAWSDDGLETVELSGNVLFARDAFESEPRMTFTTDRLRGWVDTQRFETESPVRFTRGTDVTSARGGLVYDNVSRALELRGGVQSVFHPQNFGSAAKKAEHDRP